MAYYIYNRYSPGSPGMVDRETAERVAYDEQKCYDDALEGIYGEEQKRRAEVLGLRGIVESVDYRGTTRHAYDLITDETLITSGHEEEIIKWLRHNPDGYYFSFSTAGQLRLMRWEWGHLRDRKGKAEKAAFESLCHAGILIKREDRPECWVLTPWLRRA